MPNLGETHTIGGLWQLSASSKAATDGEKKDLSRFEKCSYSYVFFPFNQ